MPVDRLICLQPLKDLLAVLQNACALVDRNRRVRGKPAGIPFPVRIVCYIALRQGAIYKPQIAPVNVRLCHNQVPLSYKFYVLS